MKVAVVRKFICILVILCVGVFSYAQVIKPYDDQLIEVEQKLKAGDFQSAVHVLNNIIEHYPNADDAYYAKALLLGQVGNLELAIMNAEQAYTLAPSLVYYDYLMDLYGANKDVDKGLETIRQARELFPNETSIGRDLIVTLGHLSKVDESFRVYNDEIKRGYHSDTLDIVMADVFFANEQIDKGVALLLPWQGKSSLGSVYGKLAFVNLEQKKNKAAIAILENGLKVSKDPLLYFDLANALSIDKKSKLAFEALKKGFESPQVDFGVKYRVMLDLLGKDDQTFSVDQLQSLANALTLTHPRVAESHMIKGEVLWKRGNTAEAKSNFLTAIGISPNQIDAWRMLINLDIAIKDLDAAILHSREALNANPNNPILLYFSGLAYFVKEDNKQARELLEAALNNSTSENKYLQSIIYTSLGDLYNKLDMHAMSDVAYEEAVKLDSTNSNAMNNMAYYLSLRKKDLDKAAEYSFRSIQLEPNMSTYLDTYAWVLFQQGKYDEALKWIEKAVKQSANPSHVMIDHYGDILSVLGRTKEAIKQWQKAVNLIEINLTDKAKIEEKIKNKKYVE